MSRFITAPDIVDKQTYTVTLVDPTPEDIERVGLYCATLDTNYDIYLYNGDYGDLQYLQKLSERSDKVLINETSKVVISGSKNVEQVGSSYLLKSPLEYFESLNG